MNWQIYPIELFEDHLSDWDKLNTSNGNTPLLDSRFVIPLLRNFGTQSEKLAICKANGLVCCMAIVVKVRTGVWQTFQPSQAPIGCWVQQTEYSTETLANALRKKLPGFALLLGITQQDPSLLPRPENSRLLDTMDYINTARVPVEGSFEEYWSKRGKNLRQNLRRQRNRLERENVDVKLIQIRDTDLMHDAVKDYGQLESKGWKSESNTAIHIDNPQGLFYTQMLCNLAETGQALVFQYRYNDVLVASDLCISGGGNLVILKTTYDESITTSSPAMLMREDAFNYIFSDQVADRIEFYGKIMDWHTRWSDEARTMYHINVYSTIGSTIKSIRERQ